jgi:polysaccharide biosynthesis protein PslE
MNDLANTLLRHKRKGALFFAVVMIGTILFTIFAPRKFRSEGKLYLRLGRENATLDPTVTLGENSIVAMPQSRENEINSVAEMVQSRAVLEKVVDKLGPAVVLEEATGAQTKDESAAASSVSTGGFKNTVKSLLGLPIISDHNRAVVKIEKNLKVEPARKSSVIEINYVAGSPKSAQSVVAALIDAYLAEHVRLNRPQGSHDFFTAQTSRLRDDMAQKEEALRDLKNRTGVASARDQKKQLIERIGRLEDDLQETDTARAVSGAKVAALRQELADLPDTQVTQETTGYGNDGTDRMRDQLYALHVREGEAAAKYTSDHPKLQQIRDQIDEAKQILAHEQRTRTQVTKEPGRLKEQTQRELLAEEPILASLNARSRQSRSQLATARDELKTFNENELRVADLEREVEMLEGEYRKYSASLEQARIDQALQMERMSNINVAQQATCDEAPISPRPLVNLLLGLGAGLFGAVGVCLGCDRLGKSQLAPQELEKSLSTPVLAPANCGRSNGNGHLERCK